MHYTTGTLGYTYQPPALNSDNKMHRHKQVRMKPHGAPKQAAMPRTFDPDELTRRLNRVIADQRAQADKKRRAKKRAEKAAAEAAAKGRGSSDRRDSKATEDEDDGHYIPKVAASQFTSTTIGGESQADSKLVHRLSRVAMKFHMQGPGEMVPSKSSNPAEDIKALRRAQTTRERTYDRNQFQHPSSFTAHIEDRDAPGPLMKMAEEDEAKLKADRRKSTGSMLGAKVDVPAMSTSFPHEFSLDKRPSGEQSELAANVDSHRVDWSQSDEQSFEHRASLPIRQQGSRWNLRGRLGSLSKQPKDDKNSGSDEEKGNSPLSPKTGFFSRFKR